MKKVNIRKTVAVEPKVEETNLIDEEIVVEETKKPKVTTRKKTVSNKKPTTTKKTSTKDEVPKSTKKTSTKDEVPKSTKKASTRKKETQNFKDEESHVEFPVLDGGNNNRLTTNESYSYLKYLIHENGYDSLTKLTKTQIIDCMHLIGEMVEGLNSMGFSCSPFGTTVKCSSKTKDATVYLYNKSLKGTEGINTLKFPTQTATIKASTYGGETLQSYNDPEFDENGNIIAFITDDNERIVLEDLDRDFKEKLVKNRGN